mmetsp:Transcript_30133/g.90269  ORF Transcript_30133/g.90269 Transcript_30133/m.90269 type:complete len:980 (+) Transcript_30133:3-2942(+)
MVGDSRGWRGPMAAVVAMGAISAVLARPLVSGHPNGPGDEPTDLHALECAIHKFAYTFGLSKVPSAGPALHAALNLDNCSDAPIDDSISSHAIRAQIAKIRAQSTSLVSGPPSRRRVSATLSRGTAASTFFLSPTGSDSAAGTETAPFATFARAAAAARTAPKPVLVSVGAGKYYFNETLQLGAADSGVTWNASGGVTLSGGVLLRPQWKPSKISPKILVADVSHPSGLLSDAERAFWAKRRASESADCANDNCGIEPYVDLRGYDVGSGNASSAVACCASCAAHPDCTFFTFRAKGENDPMCWLKSSDAGRHPAGPPDPHFSGKPNSGPPSPMPPTPPPVPPTPGPPAHKWGSPPAKWNTLHVGGVRQVRARFPNGNPQDGSGKCFSKVQYPGEGCGGWLSAHGGVGSLPGSTNAGSVSSTLDRNNAPLSPTDGGGSYGTFHYTIYDPPTGHPVYNKPMPDWTWSNKSLFSFWGDPLSRPGGVKYDGDINKTYSNPATGVVQMFHSGLWGGWTYQMVDQDVGGQSLLFSHGGYQEGRGSGINSNHYYVENLLEELDAPGEWFFDPVESQLYFYPNSTDGTPGSEVVAPLLSSIVRIEGGSDIAFSGFTITETRATFLEQYEVPSGGDWSVHRGASIEIVDSSNISVTDCTFDQIGGNGILLSNAAHDSVILRNEFVQTGDSAVVAVGSSVGIVGTGQTYPKNNIIAENHMHETGVYGKQTSCYFQALGQANRFEDNLCYNGPRAGINWNDGFAGGSTVSGNLVFNQVRETGDHGPYNSWDRQPYLTHSGVADGYNETEKHGTTNASILKMHDLITKNFFINGYNGVWTIDHDDGSQYFNDTLNFMVFGGCKNYLGNHKSCDHNVIIHPGIGSRSSGGRRCQTDDNKVFQNQYHDNNHCVTQDGQFYSMGISACSASAIDPHVYQTFNNTLYSTNATFANGPCSSFAAWQGAGQDRLSQVLPLPSTADMVAMGQAVLAV